jgi:heme/copper-type cytochrome/quinol oxidase subunit 3
VVEPKLAAALISTAIIVPAALFARSAQAEAPSGKAPAIVGRVGLSALFLFGFLCTRGVEILYLLGPDTPLTAESFSEGYFAVSAAHCAVAAVSILWLILVLLRTAKRGVSQRPSKFLNGAVRFLYFVTGAWLLLVATYYLF